MGGSIDIGNVFSSYDKYAQGVVGNVTSGNVGGMINDSLTSIGTSLDPGGLLIKSDNKSLVEAQTLLDPGGIGAKTTAASNAAQTAADKQTAAIMKKQAQIDAEKKKLEEVAAERKKRMAQNQLLSGKETGTVSLLGIK